MWLSSEPVARSPGHSNEVVSEKVAKCKTTGCVRRFVLWEVLNNFFGTTKTCYMTDVSLMANEEGSCTNSWCFLASVFPRNRFHDL